MISGFIFNLSALTCKIQQNLIACFKVLNGNQTIAFP